MSKKFKGKLCVYCSERISTVGDHVFAREFFLPEDRNNLPKAPACDECNTEKSKLEHYLSTILPFGGRHKSAKENLSTMVQKRLEKNSKLHKTLVGGRNTLWSNHERGIYLPTMGLPINSKSIESLLEFITKGLMWFHWQTYINKDNYIEVMTLTKYGEEFFDTFLCLVGNARVSGNLGKGTFCYEGLQGVDDPKISAWVFSVFGGVVLCGDPEAPNELSSKFGVLTNSKMMPQIFS